jgi:hypothetical protein
MPVQAGLNELVIETLTGIIGFTVMESWFDRAGLFVAQIRLENIWQETISPLVGE